MFRIPLPVVSLSGSLLWLLFWIGLPRWMFLSLAALAAWRHCQPSCEAPHQ